MDIPLRLIEYTTLTLECMAKDLFRVRPRVVLSPPIDLEFLIENEPDLTLAIKDGLANRYSVEGCVLKVQNSHDLHVWVDYQIYAGNWPRYNAVLAEELAHIILHKSLLLKVKSVEDFIALQKHPEWERYERDAKRFSRMVRMPAELFIADAEATYPRLVAEHGFADPIQIFKLLRNALAAKFEASPEDAQRRMLDVACNLERRVLMSVQAGRSTLAPASHVVSVRPERQPMLFDQSRPVP